MFVWVWTLGPIVGGVASQKRILFHDSGDSIKGVNSDWDSASASFNICPV